MNGHKGKIHRIAVITNPIFKACREKRAGILQYMAKHAELQPILFSGHDAASILDQHTPRQANAFDGVISELNDSVLRISREQPKLPLVIMDSDDCKIDACTVCVDNGLLARTAADLLIRRGNRHFGYVGTDLPSERYNSNDRANVFQQTVRQHGFSFSRHDPADLDGRIQSDEIPALAAWLKSLPKPCGILAFSDERAQLVISACNYSRIAIPDQVNLVGVDNDIDVCENTNPTLTSVWPDFKSAGYLGAQAMHQLLLGRVRNRRKKFLYGAKGVVERASTQDLRGGGRLVSLVCEHLHRHFRKPMKITEIADRLNVSRRLLDIRFREIMGTSIHDELERLRMEEAQRLLADTDLGVWQIASSCGYNTEMAFRKAFHRNFSADAVLRRQRKCREKPQIG